MVTKLVRRVLKIFLSACGNTRKKGLLKNFLTLKKYFFRKYDYFVYLYEKSVPYLYDNEDCGF